MTDVSHLSMLDFNDDDDDGDLLLDQGFSALHEPQDITLGLPSPIAAPKVSLERPLSLPPLQSTSLLAPRPGAFNDQAAAVEPTADSHNCYSRGRDN